MLDQVFGSDGGQEESRLRLRGAKREGSVQWEEVVSGGQHWAELDPGTTLVWGNPALANSPAHSTPGRGADSTELLASCEF